MSTTSQTQNKEHRAVILKELGTPLVLSTVSTQAPTSGQVLLRVLSVPITKGFRQFISGALPYPQVTPRVPGSAAIARIEAVGEDATTLLPGQLVYLDITLRARDNDEASALLGFFAGASPASRKLAETTWRNGSLTELLIAPLENVTVLDEELLVKQLGYSLGVITEINHLVVPYGGYASARLEPGHTVIVAFATGRFGAAAIDVALGMGASRVVAVGRNPKTLEAVRAEYNSSRLAVVALVGDLDKDSEALRQATPHGLGADVFMDLSPPGAATQHIKAAIRALKNNGRAILMGGVQDDIALPYFELVIRSIQIIGQFMYNKDAPAKIISLIESGQISLKKFSTKSFALEDIEKALDAAGENSDGKLSITVSPNVQ